MYVCSSRPPNSSSPADELAFARKVETRVIDAHGVPPLHITLYYPNVTDAGVAEQALPVVVGDAPPLLHGVPD